MTEASSLSTHKIKVQQTYDKLFRKAVAGDKEALASLMTLVQSEEGSGRYSLMDDLHQAVLPKAAQPTSKNGVIEKIKQFFGKR